MAMTIQELMKLATEYLPDTGDCDIFDPVTDELIGRCTVLTDASLEITQATNAQRGGLGNAVQFVILSDREVTQTLTTIEFDLKYFAYNLDSPITRGLQSIIKSGRKMPLENGVLKMDVPVIGNKIAVRMPGNVFETFELDADNSLDLTGYGFEDMKCADVTYSYEGFGNKVEIGTEAGAMIVKLVTHIPKYSNAFGKNGEVQVVLGRAQFSGNITLSAAAGGDAASFDMSVTALASESDDCEGKGIYGYILAVDKEDTGVMRVTKIGATPSVVELSLADGTTQQLEVKGYNGAPAINAPFLFPAASLNFASDTPATATVSATGEIAPVAEGSATVTVTYTDPTTEVVYTAMVDVTVVA